MTAGGRPTSRSPLETATFFFRAFHGLSDASRERMVASSVMRVPTSVRFGVLFGSAADAGNARNARIPRRIGVRRVGRMARQRHRRVWSLMGVSKVTRSVWEGTQPFSDMIASPRGLDYQGFILATFQLSR